MNGFDKELYVATVATATIIINFTNDVAIVWDQLLQDYQMRKCDGEYAVLGPNSQTLSCDLS